MLRPSGQAFLVHNFLGGDFSAIERETKLYDLVNLSTELSQLKVGFHAGPILWRRPAQL